MGSAFSNLDKPPSCTSFGLHSVSKVHRKDVNDGFCRCPSTCSSVTCEVSSQSPVSNVRSQSHRGAKTPEVISAAPLNMFGCTCKGPYLSGRLDSCPHMSESSFDNHFSSVSSQNLNISSANRNHSVYFSMHQPVLSEATTIPRQKFMDNQLRNQNKIDSLEQYVNNSFIIEKVNKYFDSRSASIYSVSQLRNFISSWSCNDLCCLYMEYEALHEQQLLWKEAIKTRPKAPTLEENLRLLAEREWCPNLLLSYNNSTHAAHSYLLALRSQTFENLLTTVYQGETPKETKIDILNGLNIIFPTEFDSTSTGLMKNSSLSSPPPSSVITSSCHESHDELRNYSNCPDLLPLSSNRTNYFSIDQNSKFKSLNECTRVNKLNKQEVVNEPENNSRKSFASTKLFLINFLCQLYTGSDLKFSPQKQKPDLLHQGANVDNSQSGLSKLYYYLKNDDGYNLENSPYQNDCFLTFTCSSPSTTNSSSISSLLVNKDEPVSIPCHAGIIACRSKFLCRLLKKRYTSNIHNKIDSIGGYDKLKNSVNIVLDGTILPAYFADILLHFFYCDYLNLYQLANLHIIRNDDLMCELHFKWHKEHLEQNKSKNNNDNDNNNTTNKNQLFCCKPNSINNNTNNSAESMTNQLLLLLLLDNNKHIMTFTANISDIKLPFLAKIDLIITTSKFRIENFCLQCPFCIANIIQLHPIGDILEFKRLNEACEDLLVESLNFSPCWDSEKFEFDNLQYLTSVLNSSTQSQIKMNAISLAVGLLKWANRKSNIDYDNNSLYSFNLKSNSGISSEMGKSQENTNSMNNLILDSVNSDSSKNTENLKNTISSIHFASHDTKSSVGYICRHAVYCLRQNFCLLVRSPNILQRIHPKQLYELLDSDLVQAPESEILACLLYWAELQLKSENKFSCLVKDEEESIESKTRSSHDSLNNCSKLLEDNLFTDYHLLVSSILENPSALFSKKHNHNKYSNDNNNNNNHSSTPYKHKLKDRNTNEHENNINLINHWLLLCINWDQIRKHACCDSLFTVASLNEKNSATSTNATNSTSVCHNHNNSTINNNMIRNMNDKGAIHVLEMLDGIKQPNNCHLCQLNPAFNYLFQYENEFRYLFNLISIPMSSIDLLPIIKLLLKYENLLNLLRPQHLLNNCPLQLIYLLIWAHYKELNLTLEQFKNSEFLCNFLGIKKSNLTELNLSNLNREFSKQMKSQWDVLFLLSLVMIMSTDNQTSDQQFSFSKFLLNSSTISPAQLSAKYSWAHLLNDNNNNNNNNNSNAGKDKVCECECFWNKEQFNKCNTTTTTTNNLSSNSTYFSSQYSLIFTQQSQISSNHKINTCNKQFLPPRLFYPFFNEVRMCFIQKHAYHHQNLLQATVPNDLRLKSECTCWEFVLSRKFDHFTNHMEISEHCSQKSHFLDHLNYVQTREPLDNSSIKTHKFDCDLRFADLAQKRFGHKFKEQNKSITINPQNISGQYNTICCDYKCRDFAYCLLSSSQWANVVDYYIRLIHEFNTNPMSHHPCLNIEQIYRLIRLKCLWKFGLPDSLEILFKCRINERLFMLQKPNNHNNNTNITRNLNCCENYSGISNTNTSPALNNTSTFMSNSTNVNNMKIKSTGVKDITTSTFNTTTSSHTTTATTTTTTNNNNDSLTDTKISKSVILNSSLDNHKLSCPKPKLKHKHEANVLELLPNQSISNTDVKLTSKTTSTPTPAKVSNIPFSRSDYECSKSINSRKLILESSCSPPSFHHYDYYSHLKSTERLPTCNCYSKNNLRIFRCKLCKEFLYSNLNHSLKNYAYSDLLVTDVHSQLLTPLLEHLYKHTGRKNKIPLENDCCETNLNHDSKTFYPLIFDTMTPTSILPADKNIYQDLLPNELSNSNSNSRSSSSAVIFSSCDQQKTGENLCLKYSPITTYEEYSLHSSTPSLSSYPSEYISNDNSYDNNGDKNIEANNTNRTSVPLNSIYKSYQPEINFASDIYSTYSHYLIDFTRNDCVSLSDLTDTNSHSMNY